MVALSFNPSSWEVEAGWISEFEASQGYIVRSCLKVPSPFLTHTHLSLSTLGWRGNDIQDYHFFPTSISAVKTSLPNLITSFACKRQNSIP